MLICEVLLRKGFDFSQHVTFLKSKNMQKGMCVRGVLILNIITLINLLIKTGLRIAAQCNGNS